MEVRPGYKQTEVGVIPEEWNVSQLGAMTETSSGTTPPRAMQERYYRNGSIAWVKTMDLNNSEITSTSEQVTELALNESSLRTYPVGTVLVAMYGGFQQIGRTGLLRIPATVNQAISAVQPDPTRLISEYLLATLNYRVEYWKTVASSSRKDPNISGQDIRNFPIAYPPPPEQRAIAEALSDVDALLGGLERLIAKKRDLKQAAMQQLLTGQTRLPGFSGEWKLTRLRHLVTADRFAIVDGPFGSQLKVEEYVESGVPVIEMEHLADGVIATDLARCITPTKFNDLKRSAVYPGDILISKTGTLGKLGILPPTIERGLITSRLAKITLDPAKSDRSFVLQFLLKLRRDGYWEQVSQGGTMQILGIGMLQNAPVPDIRPAEQTAIAAVLSDMDAELAALEARRSKTRDLKQAMMQELLTGKTRLVPSGTDA